jgi:hypothetical protein
MSEVKVAVVLKVDPGVARVVEAPVQPHRQLAAILEAMQKDAKM